MTDQTKPPFTLDLPPDTVRALGHQLVDRLADYLEGLRSRPVYAAHSRDAMREKLGDGPLPETGTDPGALLDRTLELLTEHARHNAHPRFLGYIVSPGSPIGALGELLAATLNQNVAASFAAPMAAEIEMQCVRWLAELVGYPHDCDGLFVSGGSMANFVGLQAALNAALPDSYSAQGLQGAPLRCYASEVTHAWISKAVRMAGLGTQSISWVATTGSGEMDPDDLERKIEEDLRAGRKPFMVVGNAGTTMTGAIDPLPELADICARHKLWLHVDGAYGAVAGILRGRYRRLSALERADSVAIDAHKWLYAPVEAGCILLKDKTRLRKVFDEAPEYIHGTFSEGEDAYFFKRGPQHSRQFRALKVWLALKQVGRQGYAQMIARDIELANALFERIRAQPELEAATVGLSITTFRYIPDDLSRDPDERNAYLNALNEALLTAIQNSGTCYISKAKVDGRFLLRACFINYRTRYEDLDVIVETTVRLGRKLHREMRRLEPEPEPAAGSAAE